MRDYPQKIEELQIEIARVSSELQTAREEIGNREALLTLDVVSTRDEAGKPLYPNEALRSAALTLARENSEELKDLRNREKLLEQTRSELFARLERLRLEFKLFLLDREAEIKAQ
jgi:predicted  nucleic acid-binding Zn-ribbon protein